MIFIVKGRDVFKNIEIYDYIVFGRSYENTKMYAVYLSPIFSSKDCFMEYGTHPHHILNGSYITLKSFSENILQIEKLF